MTEGSAFPTFEEVFEALNGYSPYLWQSRLAEEVSSSGAWPDALAAPTGAGKTAVIDIAVWHLAREASLAERCAPLRIVFCVNRRVIVDQAFERARDIAAKLSEVTSGPLLAIRDALAALSGDRGCPLHVEQLRGGLPREDDWARTPCQPTVLCTTVDQLGSRLLFRGYGVSERMAPIHAGLLGNDALILLDEAHLSDAFSETLRCVKRWRKEAETPLSLPFAACRLTATPRKGDNAFYLSEAERGEGGIAKRLRTAKPADLILALGEPNAETFIAEAERLAEALEERAPVVAIIVNRVQLARDIFDALSRSAEDGTEAERDAILLTGRVRPVERDALIREYGDRLQGCSCGQAPLFVVATQCIEAGADFDFNAMVTQVAPLDALIQRFGRLARSGEPPSSPASVIAPKTDVAAKNDDPVYGKAMKASWDWLQSNKTTEGKGRTKRDWVDFGPNAIAQLIAADAEAAGAAMTPRSPSPFLREADADFFSMTSPHPDPEPDIRLFLHGRVDIETDVSIVWRADIAAADLQRRSGEEAVALRIIEAMMPVSGEALTIPLWHARRWLTENDAAAGDLADQPATAPDGAVPRNAGRRFLRLRGGEIEVCSAPDDLRPGDTLVVPSTYGGCDRFGWHPHSSDLVEDIADQAAEPFASKRLRVRLHSALWNRSTLSDALPWSVAQTLVNEHRTSHGIAHSLLFALDKTRGSDQAESSGDKLEQALRTLSGRKCSAKPVTPYHPDEEENSGGYVLVAGADTVSTGAGDASSHTAPEALDVHAGKVRDRAAQFAQVLSLPDGLGASIQHAGFLHDDGKADERFQAYLHSFVDTDWDDIVLAKTGIASSGRTGAWAVAGLPEEGWRHEVLSVKMAIAKAGEFPAQADAALILWLVGTHHGYGRPFFRHHDMWDEAERVVDDITLPASPGPHRLSFEWDGPKASEMGLDWPGLFALLKRRYGVWGLAFLEAVMRLADHRASEDSGVAAAQEGSE